VDLARALRLHPRLRTKRNTRRLRHCYTKPHQPGPCAQPWSGSLARRPTTQPPGVQQPMTCLGEVERRPETRANDARRPTRQKATEPRVLRGDGKKKEGGMKRGHPRDTGQWAAMLQRTKVD
jgi:hypothetical protein